MKFSITFTKANKTFCMRLHYNGDNSYLFLNEKFNEIKIKQN